MGTITIVRLILQSYAALYGFSLRYSDSDRFYGLLCSSASSCGAGARVPAIGKYTKYLRK